MTKKKNNTIIYKKIIDVEVYKTHIEIYKCNDFEKIKDYLEEEHNNVIDINEEYFVGDGLSFCVEKEGERNIPIIFIKENDLSTVVHEINHHVFNIMNDVDVPFIFDNNEVFCYLLGYMMQQFQNQKWEKVEK